MAANDKTNAGVMLSESNWLVWSPAIVDTLMGCGFLWSEVGSKHFTRSKARKSNGLNAIEIIQKNVEPVIWARLAPEVAHDANVLRILDTLEELVLRFRFLDLPPEIRLEIYKYMPGLAGWRGGDKELTLCFPPFKNELKLPPMTRVCHLIREETLPIFWSGQAFTFDFADSDCNPKHVEQSQLILDTMRDWAIMVGPEQHQYLQDVSFTLRVGENQRRSGCFYDVGAIHCTVQPRHTGRAPRLLFQRKSLDDVDPSYFIEYDAVYEDMAEGRGLKGPTIFHAIFNKPELWDEIHIRRAVGDVDTEIKFLRQDNEGIAASHVFFRG